MADDRDTIRNELRLVAHELADLARPETLRHFRTGLASDNKAGPGGFDPVTEADRAAEAAMRARLAELRPDDGILGEEFGHQTGTTGITWVLDPIDGTRGYISGTPTWGVLIAASDAQGPIFGVIDQPYIGERFSGGGTQAEVDGPMGNAALSVRKTSRLEDAILLTTFPEVGTAEEGAAFRAVAEQVRLTRYGMDCYGYALLAAGQVDLVIEAGLYPYDVHAPIAVVQGAGGIVTDWRGGPCHDGGRVIAAANPTIHAQALAFLSGVE
ncbi:histidinol-phosphatase [Ponticoccus sp. SC2-23]|uniref:histidinol-phosphatase n=1 Tax=Alexandriicola marinus TaxID=2081710 RepID=UPI000FDA14D2|nr:histidinol-phosphatase [Alexandriicola marinus]MBM1219707.1 histidinol-phosphatase [Ponticoccus sp. SC6-9]MBM1223221.1 histidinol-phosphatase [Ponticoccus sp. SC6-15]MBM1229520.1 histidinol-phosphatase [Ponticoccus sp. SC6-38]MBM1232187.1 histidinol-phosphatase [Ponticoccus sp. SC6-45]MBM1237863.1 histidinol-phosphatase [Ponticoccus sp. SC6-49]MBM1241198.1 histidinol-phosphatase [Ponticoccus sp. SC2-64]MBM1245711.1 histidinol-phosphatase [Ponticoccus sp. SC6-42]MBM1250189.1 histidinol-ph